MRMWMVDPEIMCDRHLLGEHVELHMFAGTLRKGISVQGYLDKGLLEGPNIVYRHLKLAAEMSRRGFRHTSALRQGDFPPEPRGNVDRASSLRELLSRCPECRSRYNKKHPGESA